SGVAVLERRGFGLHFDLRGDDAHLAMGVNSAALPDEKLDTEHLDRAEPIAGEPEIVRADGQAGHVVSAGGLGLDQPLQTVVAGDKFDFRLRHDSAAGVRYSSVEVGPVDLGVDEAGEEGRKDGEAAKQRHRVPPIRDPYVYTFSPPNTMRC